MSREDFGLLPSGQRVHRYTIRNRHGLELRALDYGGIITSLRVPDRRGTPGDVVLGHANLEGYLTASPYFGAIIGRYANRIARGRFELDGAVYTLATNDGSNHLHGGRKGFDKVLWDVEPFSGSEGTRLVFRYSSADGEEGYPGNVDVHVTYTLTESNQLIFDYAATSDRPTPLNLTQHLYFNLAGEDHGSIVDHWLTLNADHFTPVDEELIPTGEQRSVEGTPFDFRRPTHIGTQLNHPDRQLRHGPGGFDHNFVLNRDVSASIDLHGHSDDHGPDNGYRGPDNGYRGPDNGYRGPDNGYRPRQVDRPRNLSFAARAYEPISGRAMDVYTEEPGVQFYSGNFLDGTIQGKTGNIYGRHSGFCLETQHFPDSPNRPDFPSTILRPDHTYRTCTAYCFYVK
jgi:aldose 1-epimerase